MKKTFVYAAFISFALYSCDNEKKVSGDQPSMVSDTSLGEAFKKEHTSENSLDWAGTYEGALPCADCAGIKTTVVLNQDHTFTVKEEYMKEPPVVIESKGTFEWDKAGSKVVLKGDNDYSRSFFVGENVIIHLDNDGNEIKGEMAELYRLAKKS